jgi:glycerol kinase
MEADANTHGTELRVDGGASANNFLLQFQADLFQFQVVRPNLLELTAIGAAYLAGLAVGFWGDLEELKSQWEEDKLFNPEMDAATVNNQIRLWHKAVHRSQDWIE